MPAALERRFQRRLDNVREIVSGNDAITVPASAGRLRNQSAVGEGVIVRGGETGRIREIERVRPNLETLAVGDRNVSLDRQINVGDRVLGEQQKSRFHAVRNQLTDEGLAADHALKP